MPWEATVILSPWLGPAWPLSHTFLPNERVTLPSVKPAYGTLCLPESCAHGTRTYASGSSVPVTPLHPTPLQAREGSVLGKININERLSSFLRTNTVVNVFALKLPELSLY